MLTPIFRITASAFAGRQLAYLALCAVVIALLNSPTVYAHEIGTTRVSILLQEGQTYQVEIVTDAVALAEKLQSAAGEASAIDPSLTGLQAVFARFDEPFRQRVQLAFDTQNVYPAIAYTVTPGVGPLSPAVATIRLSGQIPAEARQLTWSYAWTFASYALTVQRATAEAASTEWLEGGQTSTPFLLASPTSPIARLDTAWRYLTLGFTHILPLGFDHILFLLALLLPAVLWWQEGRWQPVMTLRLVVLDTAGIVTAFTLAHSLTLSLAVLGVLDLPSWLVETVIAFTIVLAALNNLLPVVTARRWLLAFVLGLIHGFGFASVLRELGLPNEALVLALASFNVGVEIGQLSFIMVALPLAFALRQTWAYRRLVLPVGSALVALLALIWCLERGLNITLLPAMAARGTPSVIGSSSPPLSNLPSLS